MWYRNVEDGSPEMESLFTDINGKTHRNTVPTGLVRPELWERAMVISIADMPAPVAELVSKTTSIFITKVNDSLCKASRYCDGHVVLVGDSLAAFRPHTGLAAEQAARHCLLNSSVWKGELSAEVADREMISYANRMLLGSRVVGLLGQGSAFTFCKSICSYVWFLIRSKLGLS